MLWTWLHLDRLLNWRIVKAEDSEGISRQCLLIPMDINGITVYKKGIFMKLILFTTRKVINGNDAIYRACLSLTESQRNKLVEEGFAKDMESIKTVELGLVTKA